MCNAAVYILAEGKKTYQMVQKYESPVRIYKYPFELVMTVSNFLQFSFIGAFQHCDVRLCVSNYVHALIHRITIM